jgi:hypothetical protein
VTGGTDSNISSDGNLSIGLSETASALTVVATSVFDTSKIGTATVAVSATPVTSATITDATPTVGDVLAAAVTPSNATVAYVWKVGGESKGNSETYTVSADDVGKTIVLEATGTGAFRGTVASAATSAVSDLATPASSDATLSTLSIGGVELLPAFDPSETEYSASVGFSVSAIVIDATANEAHAVVAGTGAKTLSVGANTFSVTVTAEDGATTRTYAVTITRAQVTIDSPSEPSVSAPSIEFSPSPYTPETTRSLLNADNAGVIFTVKGETVKLELPASKLLEIATKSEDNIADFDLSKVSGVTEAEFALSSISEISKANLGLNVIFSAGKVTLSAEAVAGLAQTAKGKNVIIRVEKVELEEALTVPQQKAVGDRPVHDVMILSDGVVVRDFGGNVTVSIPYELRSGEKAIGLKVYSLHEDGSQQEKSAKYDAKAKSVTYSTVELTKHYIAYAAWTNPFTDVLLSDWYYDAVEYVNRIGLFAGTGNGQFSPNAPITRSMLVTVLWRYEGSPVAATSNPFDDVEEGSWYETAVKWANANGVVSGYGNGLFGSNDMITREQMAAILYRYALAKEVKMGATSDLSGYNDALQVSNWSYDAMKWAVGAGLITGETETSLAPGNQANRASAASILMRFIENELN